MKGKLICWAIVLLAVLSVVTAAFANADHKVGICHATNSEDNPFNFVSVDKNSTAQGHDGHDDDIIPVFTYMDGDVEYTYPGKNLNTLYDGATGEDVLAAGCVLPARPTSTTEPTLPPTDIPPTPTAVPPTETPVVTEPPEPTPTPCPTSQPTPQPTSPPEVCEIIRLDWWECETGASTYTSESGDKCWCGGLTGRYITHFIDSCGNDLWWEGNWEDMWPYRYELGRYPAPGCE